MMWRILAIILAVLGLALIMLGGVQICRNYHPFGTAGSGGFSLVLEGRWVAAVLAGVLACCLSWVIGKAT
jgi:hypothetical protein